MTEDPAPQLLSRRPGEPDPYVLRAPVARYVLATRPSFLTITLAGCVLGIASAGGDGIPLDVPAAVATLVLALCAHAAVNVHNDYCDHLNGTDARNTGRIFPFTGGSRFIQNGVMSPHAVRQYARVLFAVVIAGGLALAWRVGPGLLLIGAAGMFLGWAYSSPWLRLNSRGIGELCVVLCFWLVVVGADFVARGSWAATPFFVGAPFALYTANILYINQFPDREADIAAGKLHWVARLPAQRAALGYVLTVALAVVATILPAAMGWLPAQAALGLLALPPAALAARRLLRDAVRPGSLQPAIVQTIAAAHLAAFAMAIGLAWGS